MHVLVRLSGVGGFLSRFLEAFTVNDSPTQSPGSVGLSFTLRHVHLRSAPAVRARTRS
jgi:hypothetical protein